MYTRWRVGIVGCGAIVEQLHLPTLLSLHHVEIKWLADRDNNRARRLSRAAGVPYVEYSDNLEQLPLVDLLLIAIPWGARKGLYDQIKRLTWAQKPALYIEKPFARSVAEHRAIVSGYQEWQVTAGLLRRSFGAVQCVYRFVGDRLFGNVLGVEVRYGGLGRILTRGGYSSNLSVAGGGTLFEMGVHYVDAALYCLRATDVSLVSKRVIYHEGFDMHVEASLDIVDASGNVMPMGIRISNYEHIRPVIAILCESASIQFDVGGACEITIKGVGADAATHTMPVPDRFGPTNHYAFAARHWEQCFKALDEKRINDSSASTSLLTTKAIELIYAE